MGRIVELITDVAAAADEEGANLTLPMGDFDRLRDDWGDDEIEDALALAQTAFHHEAVNEAADSLCARVVEVLGTFADEKRFASCSEPGAPLPVESLANLARSVAYLEEALSLVRDAPPPDLALFNKLLERLANRGIEAEMGPLPLAPKDEDEIEH
jgi:antitoxin component HigA of HigAB toxin-antitoxin module